ncbi:hypothetical protein EV421DRAFT_1737835 [Armillaria borealis]|uniref:Uncharacterized protein n=1 Tax=Armillaria borealis TaxID=47425 RepID=A0AA39JC68_9AGAR|nr:hypothetical protein EV421DRAFT_1737835 [Armillaria borealis]
MLCLNPSFDSWELWMSEWSECTKIEEDTPLLATFLSKSSKPRGHKCPVSLVDNSRDNDTSSNDDEEYSNVTSGDDGTGKESEEESDEAEKEILPKRTGGKGTSKPKARSSGKAASTSGTTSLAKGTTKNQKQKVPLPKKKFTTPKEPKVSLPITMPVGSPRKAAKTQPGSVKDEPAPVIWGQGREVHGLFIQGSGSCYSDNQEQEALGLQQLTGIQHIVSLALLSIGAGLVQLETG